MCPLYLQNWASSVAESEQWTAHSDVEDVAVHWGLQKTFTALAEHGGRENWSAIPAKG